MIVDSNIIIYAAAANGDRCRDFIHLHAPSVSVITQIEVLGYHKLNDIDKLLLEQLFQALNPLALTTIIVQEAIQLRQMRKMTLGDSIIAATALTHHLTLATHNTKDFTWINGINVVDPLDT
jgi:toxin FitB